MQPISNSVSETTASVSVSVWPTKAVLEQLKRQYTTEVSRLISEIAELLPSYRSVVDSEAYERDRSRIMLVAAYMSEGEMGVRALETSLNYLLKQQERLTAVLHRDI